MEMKKILFRAPKLEIRLARVVQEKYQFGRAKYQFGRANFLNMRIGQSWSLYIVKSGYRSRVLDEPKAGERVATPQAKIGSKTGGLEAEVRSTHHQ